MKKLLYQLTLWAILVLIGLSIYAAFIGADRAQGFFNSLPLAVYWSVLVLLIGASILAFRKVRRPAVLLMHLGTVLVILGSMAGSEKGHAVRRQAIAVAAHIKSVVLGGAQPAAVAPKPVQGRMLIYEGQASSELYEVTSQTSFQLPFEIALKDFIVETYPPTLTIHFPDGHSESLTARPGQVYRFADSETTIRVVETYENFKLTLVDGQSRPVDSTQPGRNPAVEVEITKNGQTRRQYVFELFAGHASPERDFMLTYHRPIRDYISRVDVLRDGQVVTSAAIEVNHPLHFGGYHFYQYSYDDKQHQYTILQAVSDTGLYTVYAGYALLCAGVVWYFWFIRLRRR